MMFYICGNPKDTDHPLFDRSAGTSDRFDRRHNHCDQVVTTQNTAQKQFHFYILSVDRIHFLLSVTTI